MDSITSSAQASREETAWKRCFAYAVIDRKLTDRDHEKLTEAWKLKGGELTHEEVEAIIGPNRTPIQEGPSDA